MKTPPPCDVLSFLYVSNESGKIREFGIDSSSQDSVPIIISG
jgi:hypothetical protein